MAPAIYLVPDDPTIRRVQVQSIFNEPQIIRGEPRR